MSESAIRTVMRVEQIKTRAQAVGLEWQPLWDEANGRPEPLGANVQTVRINCLRTRIVAGKRGVSDGT